MQKIQQNQKQTLKKLMISIEKLVDENKSATEKKDKIIKQLRIQNEQLLSKNTQLQKEYDKINRLKMNIERENEALRKQLASVMNRLKQNQEHQGQKMKMKLMLAQEKNAQLLRSQKKLNEQLERIKLIVKNKEEQMKAKVEQAEDMKIQKKQIQNHFEHIERENEVLNKQLASVMNRLNHFEHIKRENEALRKQIENNLNVKMKQKQLECSQLIKQIQQLASVMNRLKQKQNLNKHNPEQYKVKNPQKINHLNKNISLENNYQIKNLPNNKNKTMMAMAIPPKYKKIQEKKHPNYEREVLIVEKTQEKNLIPHTFQIEILAGKNQVIAESQDLFPNLSVQSSSLINKYQLAQKISKIFSKVNKIQKIPSLRSKFLAKTDTTLQPFIQYFKSPEKLENIVIFFETTTKRCFSIFIKQIPKAGQQALSPIIFFKLQKNSLEYPKYFQQHIKKTKTLKFDFKENTLYFGSTQIKICNDLRIYCSTNSFGYFKFLNEEIVLGEDKGIIQKRVKKMEMYQVVQQ